MCVVGHCDNIDKLNICQQQKEDSININREEFGVEKIKIGVDNILTTV
ncbi:3040_t:CDS:1, partial [Dentiscutata heterogama]